MREDIRPGAIFPDFEVPDHTGVKRKLPFLQGADPMIVMLGRGIYGPKDRQHPHGGGGGSVRGGWRRPAARA